MASGHPNILFLMADQMSALALPFYGNAVVRAPNLAALARRSVVFENAYCGFPLCAPSRFAMMAGRLASRIGAYDNGAEFPSSVPTFVHYLRNLGYYTCVSGKLHFVGADQLHGFEDRLTTDIYPADFGWCANWDQGAPGGEVTEGGVSGPETVTDAGPYARSLQIDYDEEVFARGLQKIYDLARSPRDRPFFLMVSFTQPHDPYVTTREYWDLYDGVEIPPPAVADIPMAARDAHSRELLSHYGLDDRPVSVAAARRARRGYYGMIGDIDAKLGRLLAALADAGLAGDTITLFTSDHGDMMGEHGLWFKKTFFEWAMRVPLIIGGVDGCAPRRVARNVSLLDLLPTLVELAGGGPDEIAGDIDGRSLVELMRGTEAAWPDLVLAEHLDEGTRAPRFMLRRGAYKYVWSEAYPPLLFDLSEDPLERENLAGAGRVSAIEADFLGDIERTWDAARLRQDIIADQRRRRLVFSALSKGRWTPWDYQPPADAATRFVRHGDRFPDVERAGYLPYSKARSLPAVGQ
jgi:choline-sulfatase